ncbi:MULTISPECIES: DUF1236 domain-containing protein [Brucella]|uniref:DUF1236 domain-containing protein n=1 Tax=Ochrobactrum soli TaxID=2448455 RepID=A0A2P9HGU2_9HYPH|nr:MULTISPECIES: DUF1236 domain-containing protein [Brucella]RRD24614.1 DUF1236 domain-containing protein [Brucellaceae bacterium VT-16-1752]WHT43164.1 DUF1236 domain-containing protein [Ochrobactrum sp. SSR]MDX4073432.1 DUF1236 domain-containing protein [Brucella sp. NBRC 113783]WHS33061.1 DUF1236 domain-containing protein [Brucella sp. NM4]SPL63286.1 hypothetical protein OHAE_3218 [[Ochrobactrum] soli]
MKKALILTAAAFLATTGLAAAQDAVIIEVPQSARDYVIAHPVDPVVIQDDIAQGYVVPEAVVVRPIPDNPDFGYIYVNGEPVIVSMQNRQVVYYDEGPNAGPPVPVVPDDVVTFIESHPIEPITIEGELTEGMVIPEDVPLVAVPDQPNYSYVYIDQRPALVEPQTRRVIWVK